MEGIEATFILKDVIYIVVGVASALGFYWKMVMSDRSQEDKIRQMQKDIQVGMFPSCHLMTNCVSSKLFLIVSLDVSFICEKSINSKSVKLITAYVL